jgi:malonyl-CoA O-methyltransferase
VNGDAFQLDKQRVRAAFERAAEGYDRIAVLQREVGGRLLERLDLMKIQPGRVLDLGSGTGQIMRAAVKRYRGAQLVGVDIAESMLQAARRARRWWRRPALVCGDMESLPMAAASVDMVLSNLSLQWCNDLDRVMAELRRVLRPGGVLLFTTLGPDTLKELRASWSTVDSSCHVNTFLDMHDVGDAMLRAGLSDPVVDREDLILTYPDLHRLMRDLKGLGAHNVTAGRPRGLTTPTRLRKLEAAYEAYRRDDGLPANYEVIYGHAWKPQPAAVELALSGIRQAKSPRTGQS